MNDPKTTSGKKRRNANLTQAGLAAVVLWLGTFAIGAHLSAVELRPPPMGFLEKAKNAIFPDKVRKAREAQANTAVFLEVLEVAGAVFFGGILIMMRLSQRHATPGIATSSQVTKSERDEAVPENHDLADPDLNGARCGSPGRKTFRGARKECREVKHGLS